MLTLAITGFAADPADVARLLGIQPSKTATVGQLQADGRGSAYEFNGWWSEVRSKILGNRGIEHAEAMTEIVEIMSGREPLFQSVWRELCPKKMEIYGAMKVPRNDQCGIWLEPREMAVLANCWVGWGIDLVSVGR
jgi:hypothetical protein